MDIKNLVYICSRISKKEVFINKLVVSMQTIEELIKRGYDDLSYEEKKYLCEHFPITENNTQLDNPIIIKVPSVDAFVNEIGGITLDEFRKHYR